MPYQQGVHHTGVQNEKDLVKFQNENQDNAINKRLTGQSANQQCVWRQVGGTKHTEDAVATTTNDDGSTQVHKISIKNHKTGTWDWLNTTQAVPDALKTRLIEFKEAHYGAEITPELRKQFADLFVSFIDSLDSATVKAILLRIFLEYPEHILVNDKKINSLIMFGKNNMLNPAAGPQDVKYVLKQASARGKTSRQIWIQKSNGEEVNTHLRLRLTTNNGITALLGHSSANRTSAACIKIQQDKTDDFIESCSDKIIIPY